MALNVSVRAWRRAGMRFGCFVVLTWLLSTNSVAMTPDALVGLWKTPGGNIVEVKLQGGALRATVKELSPRASGFTVGEDALRNIVVSGDTISFEIAFRETVPPHTLEWVKCSAAQLVKGTLVGTARPVDFDPKTHVARETGNTAEYALVPRCPKLEGALNLGKFGGADLTVELNEALSHGDEDSGPNAAPHPRDRKGFCRLDGVGIASTAIQTTDIPGGNGAFRLSPKITGCDIELFWKEYTDARKENGIQETSLAWTDDETAALTVFERWGIQFKVYAFGATFARADGDALRMSEAFLELQMDVDGPTQALGPFYLAGDLSSTISYVWDDQGKGVSSWTEGKWSFSSMANVVLELRHGGYEPIATMSLAFNDQGEVQSKLTLTGEQGWTSGGYKIALKTCTIEALISLKDNTITVLGGSITGELEAGAPLNGKFDFTLERQSNGTADQRNKVFRMSIASTSKVSAFGGDLTALKLGTDLDPDTLDFKKVEGSVTYKHPDLEVAIGGFTIDDGQLTRFLGSGNVSYRGFALNVRRLSYDATVTPAILEVSAALNLGWSNAGAGAAEIENFRIDANGVVSSLSIHASVNASPVVVEFEAAFSQTEFSGRFRGQFGGSADFGGSVVIGRRDDFTYGGLGIFFNISGGVPIGQTGLKLLGLNGAFGCNYNPEGSPLGTPFGARKDIYYIEAGLTIGDAAGLASLNGTVSLVLGDAKAVGISGTLQVTQQTPYFRGKLTCNYILGSGEVSGSLSSTVKIPIDGSIVSINDNTLNYKMDAAGWNLRGRGLGGTFFSFLRLSEGAIDLSSAANTPISAMTGKMSGRIDGRVGTRWAYPPDFRCESERYDFGLAANFSAEVTGSLENVELSAEGSRGTFKVNVALSGKGSLRLRSGWFGFDCASVGLTATGRLEATKVNQNLQLAGDLQVSDSSGWISKQLQFSNVF